MPGHVGGSRGVAGTLATPEREMSCRGRRQRTGSRGRSAACRSRGGCVLRQPWVRDPARRRGRDHPRSRPLCRSGRRIGKEGAGERLALRNTVGRGVVEARPPIRADKGTATRKVVEEYGPEKALFMGDDTTDLDAFRELDALREEGTLSEMLRVGIKSEEGPPEIVSEADLVVDIEEVGKILRALLDEK